MYNLKIEAKKIIQELQDNGFEAYFVGNYPFVKQHNLSNPTEKLKIRTIDIVTNATLEDLKSRFKVVKVNMDFNRSVFIELPVKQNFLRFRVYHAADYVCPVNKKVKQVSTINDILTNFGFLIDTLILDNNGKVVDFSNKKLSAFDSISAKTLQSNGNFREKLMENPMIIFELCYYASNINYKLNESNLKIISNNKDYLKKIELSTIVKYVNKILLSKRPIIGLSIIKENLITFQYNDKCIFEFLKYCSDDRLNKISNFNSSIDIVARWAYLFKDVPQELTSELLDRLGLTYKDKILWLLNNYEIVDAEDNYKMEIYNSKESLREIKIAKYDVFLLHEMFDRLTKLRVILDENKKEICSKIMDTICSRPFFTYQVAYSNDDISKLAGIPKGDWIESVKEKLVKKIILEQKHPDDNKYIELLKECIES